MKIIDKHEKDLYNQQKETVLWIYSGAALAILPFLAALGDACGFFDVIDKLCPQNPYLTLILTIIYSIVFSLLFAVGGHRLRELNDKILSLSKPMESSISDDQRKALIASLRLRRRKELIVFVMIVGIGFLLQLIARIVVAFYGAVPEEDTYTVEAMEHVMTAPKLMQAIFLGVTPLFVGLFIATVVYYSLSPAVVSAKKHNRKLRLAIVRRSIQSDLTMIGTSDNYAEALYKWLSTKYTVYNNEAELSHWKRITDALRKIACHNKMDVDETQKVFVDAYIGNREVVANHDHGHSHEEGGQL